MAETRDAGRVGFVLKGDYNPNAVYERLDAVLYSNGTYIAKKDTTGNLPTDEEFWQEATSLGTHASTPITDEESVHSVRYFGKRLQVKINDEWVDVDGDTIAEMQEQVDAAAADAVRAKEAADRAVAVVGIDIATYEKAGLVKPDPETLEIDPDGTLRVIGGGGSAIQLMVTAPEDSTITILSGSQVIDTAEGGTVTFDIKNYGTYIIRATRGYAVAEKELVIDISKLYVETLKYFTATIETTYPEGATCTIIREGEVVGTATTNPYTFEVYAAGTYTVKAVLGEDEDSKDVVISEDGETQTVTLSFAPEINWQAWVEAGGLSVLSYDSLESVLDDQKAVRRLMTVHASVDYLVELLNEVPEVQQTFLTHTTTHTLPDTETSVTENFALKWMGLRDYAYDKIEAEVDGFVTAWLAGEHWELALKDHVPVMTANDAPYGEVISDTLDTYTWRVFDKNDATRGATTNPSGLPADSRYIGYKFSTPICIQKIKQHQGDVGAYALSYVIEGSNDGTIWEAVSETLYTTNDEKNTDKFEWLNNNKYYLQYRFRQITSAFNGIFNPLGFMELQFYGRSLNVSVPVMTSNTEPWGEVIYSNQYNEAFAIFKAFDQNLETAGACRGGAGNYIGYKFVNPTGIKNLNIRVTNGGNFSVQASNDLQKWDNLNTFTISDDGILDISVDNYSYYTAYRLVCNSLSSGSNFGLKILQFYGVDYSEREFAPGSTMQYIYDHGVEFMTLSSNTPSGKAEKFSDYLYLEKTEEAIVNNYFITSNMADLSNKKFEKAIICNLYKRGLYEAIAATTNFSTFTSEALKYTFSNAPNCDFLDISTINQPCYLFITSTGNKIEFPYVSIYEWWLE